MDVVGYQAKRVREQFSTGEYLPTIGDIVETVLTRYKGTMKLEEIIDQVHSSTGIAKDADLRSAVARQLRKLEKDSIVCHVSHGIWQIKAS